MNDIETAIVMLSPDATPEQIGEVRERVRRAVEAAKELERVLDQRIEEFVRERGELTIGTVRYYLGRKKVTKCINPAATLETVLMLAMGDMEAACRDFLAASPFKHGAIKTALGATDIYASLFVTEEVEKLEEGEPRKQLQKVDVRFLSR